MDIIITKENLVGFGLDGKNMLICILDTSSEISVYHWLSFSSEALRMILEENLARTSKFNNSCEDPCD